MAKEKKGPRTNFHKEVYGQEEYQELLLEVGCQYKTRGLLLVAWELAQKHWLEHKAVPFDKFPEALHVLLRHGFAKEETREDGRFIYVSGSSEHCKFLEKQSANGTKGGRSKSPKKLANLRQYAKNPEAKPKPDRSQKNPTEVSTSISVSTSELVPKTSSSGEVAAPPAPSDLVPKGKNAVALWLEAYHRKYRVRYPDMGKDHGTLTALEKRYSGPELEILFACYLAIKDPLYEKQSHPLSLFFRDLPKISLAAQTGVDPTNGPEPDWQRKIREDEERKRRGA